jgi:beta-galactosidase
MDLSYVLIEAYDDDGNPHPLSDARVFEPFQAEYVDLFFGKAMLILRSGQEAGRVTITATADGELRASGLRTRRE